MNSKPVISVFSDFPETGITVILLIIGVLTAVCIGRYAAGRFEGNKKRIPIIFAGLTLGVSALMLWRYGTGVTALKGILPSGIWRHISCKGKFRRKTSMTIML